MSIWLLIGLACLMVIVLRGDSWSGDGAGGAMPRAPRPVTLLEVGDHKIPVIKVIRSGFSRRDGVTMTVRTRIRPLRWSSAPERI